MRLWSNLIGSAMSMVQRKLVKITLIRQETDFFRSSIPVGNKELPAVLILQVNLFWYRRFEIPLQAFAFPAVAEELYCPATIFEVNLTMIRHIWL